MGSRHGTSVRGDERFDVLRRPAGSIRDLVHAPRR